jgi:hypothetical protein
VRRTNHQRGFGRRPKRRRPGPGYRSGMAVPQWVDASAEVSARVDEIVARWDR